MECRICVLCWSFVMVCIAVQGGDGGMWCVVTVCAVVCRDGVL